MSERDELARVIFDAPALIAWDNRSQRIIADAILAAGYRKPRTVTTSEELDALPVDSVVRDTKGFVYQKWADIDEPEIPWWAAAGDSRMYPANRIALPATVLHEGEA